MTRRISGMITTSAVSCLASVLAPLATAAQINPQIPEADASELCEIQTSRWVLYDKVRFGIELPELVKLTHQERAYT